VGLGGDLAKLAQGEVVGAVGEQVIGDGLVDVVVAVAAGDLFGGRLPIVRR